MTPHQLTKTCALLTAIALAACSQSGGSIGPLVILPPPSLSWTASWTTGVQTGPITFQTIGQNAALTATATPSGAQPPYGISSGTCVTLSSPAVNGATETVTVTSAAHGQCTVTFSAPANTNRAISVTVP